MKNFSWKIVSVFVVFIIAVILIIPTFKPDTWPRKKINLGLDLQGGMHLVLEVDTQKAVESTIDRINNEIKTLMRKEKIKYQSIDILQSIKISVNIKGQDHIDKFEEILDKEFRELRIASRSVENDVLKLILDLPEEEMKSIKKMATEQALETIRNRIDELGVSEPDIRIQGEKRILIQLPGIKDTNRAKKLIGRTALLEFKLVDDANSLDAALKGNVPRGREVLYEIRKDPTTHRERKIPYLVKKRAVLTGASLTDARVEIDNQYGRPYVGIEFDKKGGRTFARITEENVKKRLAIVLDDKIYSAPVIQEKIGGGRAQITGNYSHEEAHDLAIVLRAGALPAPVKIVEERTVGPSLGKDSIRKGFMSMLIGGLVVVLFMVIYYKGAGLIANFALAMNILLIGAALAALQATLTLPGIAGIILTIGMAVDSNVLIFERIREELACGKTALAALAAGFDRATLTILDANVTTLIAAVVLFQFGTGPVKGFAVTLIFGVVSSLFTALVLARIIFEYCLVNLKFKNLSI